MNYSDLKLKINTNYNVLTIKDQQIQILQYLPIKDKIDLIELALQNSFENGIYNEMKLDMYFNLYIVYMYTNLEFSDEEKANEELLYDELESNGILIDILGAMDDTEYATLMDYLEKMKTNIESYGRSTAALLQSFVQDLPRNAEAAAQIVDNFDKEKYKEVVKFAQYANGNRPL